MMSGECEVCGEHTMECSCRKRLSKWLPKWIVLIGYAITAFWLAFICLSIGELPSAHLHLFSIMIGMFLGADIVYGEDIQN